ncbi:Hypothetical predicted protein [Mytilus galloprovincialis]|uniref:Endonuclease/exonuclease/phosphatase domain-containing protein n=1 Tax=Mytilus galloprovincialis TaxID=29158 RepID=A0A8B6DM60_MYTGA|nr:Hypothetical predicted protein [Mytilus galloprovincialis]
MPCRGSKYVNSEFNDILDQLREIINKYSPKYQFVLCGDWNCDISSRYQNIKLSERQAALRNFLQETNLTFNETDVTFIHPNGQEVSTIDYIFRSNEIDPDLNLTKRLDMLPSNTSDHHPIHTTIQCHFESKIKKVEKNIQYPSKVNWSKIDLEKYQTEITNKINELEAKEKIIDVKDLIHALTVVQENFSKKSKPHKQKNTHIWNDEIALALLNNKKALFDWKEDGKPKSGKSATLRKNSRSELRRARRHEIARQRDEKYAEIMNTRSGDTKSFYKLINNQRKQGKTSIAEII